MEQGTQMTIDPLAISSNGIQETVRLLQHATERECVLLWLGRRNGKVQSIIEVFRPTQNASADYFEIPRVGMLELMERLRTQGLYVAAQVHTHPREAFHSQADDKWAIVRHQGAISIVLPYFAKNTHLRNFLTEAAFFQLSHSNSWVPVDSAALNNVIRISP